MFFEVLSALAVGLLLYRWIRRDRIDLPGPTPWPVLGNILQVQPDRPHQTFLQWHKTFNRDYKMYRLGTPVVVVGSTEGMEEVLVKKGKDFAGRFYTHRLSLWDECTGVQDAIVFSPPNPCWKMLRMCVQKHLKQFDSGMQRIEEVNAEICQDMIENFASHNGKPFEPRPYVMNAIMNNIAMFLLGKKFDVDAKLFRQFFDMEQLTMEVFSPVGTHANIDVFPWLRFFQSKTDKRFRLVIQKSNELFDQFNIEVEDVDNHEPLFTVFLNLLTEPEFIGEEGKMRIKFACMNLIFAGSATSTSTLHAFLNIITHYRDVYRNLQSEVDEVLGSRPATLADRENMPYTRATIFELLRYSSVVPFSIPHMTTQDTSLGDARIPSGTEVIISLWSSFHDESYWPEPFLFKPERFLDGAGNLLSPDSEARKRLMSFGAGPRVCIGEKFALARLFLMITSTIQKMEIEQPEPKVSCDPRNYKMATVLTPPDFQIIMTPRHFE